MKQAVCIACASHPRYPMSQGVALYHSRFLSAHVSSGMCTSGVRAPMPAADGGAACKMTLSRFRIVRVFPVPGGPYTRPAGQLHAWHVHLHDGCMCPCSASGAEGSVTAHRSSSHWWRARSLLTLLGPNF